MTDLPNRNLRPLRAALLSLALGAGLALSADAAEPTRHWVSLGPFGGMIRQLAQGVSDPQRLYAVSERFDLFRSRDGGRSWRSVRRGLAGSNLLDAAVAPSDPDVVLVTTYGGSPVSQIWHSQDGGDTWKAAVLPPRRDGEVLSACDLHFDAADPRTVYAGTDFGIYRSRDGGSTWHPWSLSQASVFALARTEQTPAVWFAAGRDLQDFHFAIYRSDDLGLTWQETPGVGAPGFDKLLSRLFVQAGALYAHWDGALYRSTDGAATWNLAARLPSFFGLDFGIGSSGTIYAASDFGIYSSTDGTNWSPPEAASSDDAKPRDGVGSLVILASDETVVAAGRRGVWRSTDRGESWKPSSRGIALHDVESLIVIPDSQGTVLGTFDDGTYRIDRDGRRWQFLRGQAGFEYVALATDPHHPGRIYGLGNRSFGVSEDRGNSWRKLSDLPHERVFLVKVDPVHPDVLYAGLTIGGGSSGEDVAYRSVDGGIHWTEILNDVLFDVTFDPARPNLGFRLTSSGIDKTTDGGNQWQRLPNLPELLRGSAPSSILIDSRSRALYVGTEDRGVFRSTDSGRTFRRINAGLPGLPGGRFPAAGSLIEDAAGDVYAALPYVGVFQLNPGHGWTAVNTGLPLETFVRTLVPDPVIPGLLYAGSIGSSVHRLEED